MSLADYNEDTMSIPEFFRGRSILVTGFTGTLGKLLVEKLLYSCPDINKIYVIVRSKRGKTMQQRVEETLKSKVFDRLHEKYSAEVFKSKLIPLSGDMAEKRLGLSHDDEEVIRNEVSVIFHGAASVRFDDPLDEAIKTNLLPAKGMIDLALTMRKLVCLMYISTAYTNCDRLHIKEKLYPAKVKWTQLIDICNNTDPAALRVLSMKYIKNMPNTYTFTKSIGEHVMNDYKDRLPIVVIRPSIVMPALREPIPGWVDNLNGPLGLTVGVFVGLLRMLYLNKNLKINFVCSDVVINSFVVAAWKTGIKHLSKGLDNSMAIYNATSPLEYNLTLENYFGLSQKGFVHRGLLDDGMNSGFVESTKSELSFKFHVFLKNFLPAVLIDSLLMALGKSPALTKLRRKLLVAQLSMKRFTFVQFTFDSDNFDALLNDLNEEDKKNFSWDFKQDGFDKLYLVAYPCFKYVLLKPVHDDLKTNTKRMRWLYYLDKGCYYIPVSVLAWVAFKLAILPMIEVVKNFYII